MRPAMSLCLVFLLLSASITQGIRLEQESLAAFRNEIHEKARLGRESRAEEAVAPCRSDGHCSGRSRKLIMTKEKAVTENEKTGKMRIGDAQSHRPSTGKLSGSQEDLHMAPPVPKQAPAFPDMLDISGMDYSPAKRKPPIHN